MFCHSPASVKGTLKNINAATEALDGIIASSKQSFGTVQNLQLQHVLNDFKEDLNKLLASYENLTINCDCLASKNAVLWAHLEKLQSVPKNEKEAVVKLLNDNKRLVEDAYAELENVETEIKESGEDDAVVGDKIVSTNKRLENSKYMINVAKAIISKVIDSVDNFPYEVSQNDFLGQLASAAERLSPSIDDLITAFYDDVSQEDIRQEAHKLRNNIRAVIELFRSSPFSASDIQRRCDFLLTAVEHNYNKF